MPPSGSRCLAVTCSDLPDHGQAISRGLPPAGQGGWTCGTAHGRTSADTYRTVRRFSFWSVFAPASCTCPSRRSRSTSTRSSPSSAWARSSSLTAGSPPCWRSCATRACAV